MKNFEPVLLLTITILFIGLMFGLLAGRYFGQTVVQLSKYDHQSTINTEGSEKADGKININLATVKELAMLPGIGEATAQNIVDYRNTYGLYTSIYELGNVKGIGKKRIESIEQYITVGGQS